MASDVNKPDGQCVISSTRDDVLSFLSQLPCRKVGGIGKVTERTLAAPALGVHRVGQLLSLSHRVQLKRVFSKKTFGFLLRVGLGLDGDVAGNGLKNSRKGSNSRKSISTERTFAPLSEPADMEAKLRSLAESLAKHVAQKRLSPARTLTLKLKTTTFDLWTRQTTEGGPWGCTPDVHCATNERHKSGTGSGSESASEVSISCHKVDIQRCENKIFAAGQRLLSAELAAAQARQSQLARRAADNNHNGLCTFQVRLMGLRL